MHVKHLEQCLVQTGVWSDLPAGSLKAFDLTAAGRCESSNIVSITYLPIYPSINFSAICYLAGSAGKSRILNKFKTSSKYSFSLPSLSFLLENVIWIALALFSPWWVVPCRPPILTSCESTWRAFRLDFILLLVACLLSSTRVWILIEA